MLTSTSRLWRKVARFADLVQDVGHGQGTYVVEDACVAQDSGLVQDVAERSG